MAAARAVRKTTGLDPRIKWPNDLMLRGRKAAGILAESAIAGEAVWYAVLGIGINVALDTQAYAEEIGPPAVSVNAGGGKRGPPGTAAPPVASRARFPVLASPSGRLSGTRVARPH